MALTIKKLEDKLKLYRKNYKATDDMPVWIEIKNKESKIIRRKIIKDIQFVIGCGKDAGNLTGVIFKLKV